MNILITQPEGNVKETHFPKEAIEKFKSIGNVKMNDLGRSELKYNKIICEV